MINVLAHVGPPHRLLIEGGAIRCYESDEPLGADGVFNTAKIRDRIYESLSGGEWITWGAARYVRARVAADENSANDGFKIEYTINGESSAGELDEATIAADVDYDSGWIARRGVGFRVSYTNGATPQTSFTIQADVCKDLPILRGGPILDGSGTIAEATTAEVIQTRDPRLTYLEITNPDEDTVSGEVLCFTVDGTTPVLGTAGTIVLQPSMSRIWEGQHVPVGPITMKSQNDDAPYTLLYSVGS